MSDKPTVLLVHGFADNNGVFTTDKLRPFFEAAGYKVKEVDYDFTELVGVAVCDTRIAKVIAALAPEGCIAVGHSNGCAILQLASTYNAPFSQLVFISPALDSKAEVGKQVERIHVWYSPLDMPVRIAEIMHLKHWGDMGAVGYTGTDPRFINYNKQEDFKVHSYTHLDIFLANNIKFFGPEIIEKLEGK
jgi:pimeloyl-ACP methyl ester carboxylesterase